MGSRFFAGLVLIVAGVAASVYGWQRLNSLSSKLGDIFGNPDTAGTILLSAGIIGIIVGIVLTVRRR